MSYQKPYDPMAKILIAVASIVLLGAVAVLLNNLSTTITRNSSVVNISSATTKSHDVSAITEMTAKTGDIKEKTENEAAADTAEVELPMSKLASAISDNIHPIGSADASAKSASSSARSGEEIFEAVCTACHTTGVLEAPKLGDKSAWELRLANGFDAVLTSALAGKGNMPAKGGDASLSDDEVKATIIYMLEKAGLDAGVSVAPAEESTDAAKPETSEDTTADTTTPEKADLVIPTTAKETTSSLEDTDVVAPVAIVETTAPASPIVPEKPASPTIPKTPETPIASSTATEATVEKPAPVVADNVVSTATEATVEKPAPVVADNSAEAKKLYKTVCFTCHDAGIAGAPIVGNVEQWTPRIAQGKEALYHSSLNGKGAMPAKGGNPSLDDDLIKATVDYMVNLSQ